MKRTKHVCTMILVTGCVATATASAQNAGTSRASETDNLSVPAAMTSAQASLLFGLYQYLK